MTDRPLRIGVDLSGPHEPLGNWMDLLATALTTHERCDVIRFETGRENFGNVDVPLRTKALWRPFWLRARGRPIDAMLPSLDVIHLAGTAMPPSLATPLVVSLDDLRPLREAGRDRQRVVQLERAAAAGAQLVASSLAASSEIQQALGLSREQVVIAPPAVFWETPVIDGENLVVNLTGQTEEFLKIVPMLTSLTRGRNARVVVLASHDASTRLRQAGADVELRLRRDAADVLSHARLVIHLSDGARFPSFTIAALAAGIPTCASPTAINRELLEGSSLLVDLSDEDEFVAGVETVFEDESRRAVLVAAGRDRAKDFSPEVAARNFSSLYESLARRRTRA